MVVHGSKRSFKVVNVKNVDGCDTKFHHGRFVNNHPAQAARKALGGLCGRKSTKGKCTLFVQVQDTTAGRRTKGKKYTYKVQRNKLAKPVIRLKGTKNEFKIKYGTDVHASEMPVNTKACKLTRKQSRGRMRKYRKNNKRAYNHN